MPLKAGKKFGDAEAIKRPDNHYCWFVASLKDFPQIKGVPPGKRSAYKLVFYTNPDHISFEFTPEIGITRYSYHHDGTVADTELRLVEFHGISRGAQE